MATKALQFKTIELVQGMADAFVEGNVATLIDPSRGIGWAIRFIEVAFATALSGVSADADIFWSLSRQSKGSTTDYGDDDVILADGVAVSLTTSGQMLIPQLHRYEVPDGVLVVQDVLYAQLDSTASGLASTAYVRVWYEEVKLGELEILRVLAEQT